MKHIILKHFLSTVLLLVLCSAFLSCKDDEKADPKPVADFTYTINEGDGVSVQFTNTSTNFVSSAWTFSDAGSVSTEASPMHKFSASGAYKVTLVVVSKDGSMSTKEKTLAISAVASNLLLNSTFTNNENWTVQTTFSDDGALIIPTFNNKITMSSTGGVQAGVIIYQAVELTPGTYKLMLNVSTEDTQNNGWLTLYLSAVEPLEGVDLSDDDIVTGIDGCTGALVGDLASLGSGECKVGNSDGQAVVETAGTYYFGIATGIYDGAFGANYNINSVSLIKIL
jgi:PKD repeat protein